MLDADEKLHEMQANVWPLAALTGQFQSDGNRVRGLRKCMSYSSRLGNIPIAVLG